jgi:hypothetical protein
MGYGAKCTSGFGGTLPEKILNIYTLRMPGNATKYFGIVIFNVNVYL